MRDLTKHRSELLDNGFSIVDGIYSEDEVQNMLTTINKTDTNKDTFRKSTDLFAIRQFLKEIPETFDILFPDKLKSVIRPVMGGNFFVVKSLYFDKPETSNWYGSYHQDLRTLKDNYKKDDYAGQLLPCCGHFFIADEENDYVAIMGCPSGIDWTIVHTDDNKIKQISDSGQQATIDKDEYKKIVLAFEDQVEDFYKTSLPKKISMDDFEKKGTWYFGENGDN